MNFLYLIKDELKIDFTDTCIVKWDTFHHKSKFNITPKEFLRFAKTDYKENNVKGYINSLTNSKRAIDCQIDTVLNILTIDFDKILPSAEHIIKFSGQLSENLSWKLKLFSSLDFAPSGLVSNVRTLRNKLEHYYENPTPKEVKDALELSELFILAVESKLSPFLESFVLTDIKSYDDRIYKQEFTTGVMFKYNFVIGKIEVTVIKNKQWSKKVEYITQANPEYYFIIKILNNFNDEIELLNSLNIFLKYLKHPIPEESIRMIKKN